MWNNSGKYPLSMHQFYLNDKEIGPQVGTSLVPASAWKEGRTPCPPGSRLQQDTMVSSWRHSQCIFYLDVGKCRHSETTRKWSMGVGAGNVPEDSWARALTEPRQPADGSLFWTRGIQRAAVPRPTLPCPVAQVMAANEPAFLPYWVAYWTPGTVHFQRFLDLIF